MCVIGLFTTLGAFFFHTSTSHTSIYVCIHRYSAVRPQERLGFITSSSNIANETTNDPNIRAFGLSNIDPQPMQVSI